MDGKLLNMSRFPNSMISGLSSDEISAEIDKQILEDNVMTDLSFPEHFPDDMESLFELTPDLNDAMNAKDLEGKQMFFILNITE